MKYVKPCDYDDFKCIADQCPDTCCANWRIEIDDESLEKYIHCQGAFGNRLINSVDFKNGIFKQYHGQCVLLNEDKLCELHKALGEEMLCDTCRIYPRHVEEYDGVREFSLSLSCPQAAQMLVSRREKLTFKTWTTDETDDFDDFDMPLFEQLTDVREKIITILQNRNLELAFRLDIVLSMAEKIQKCIDAGDIEKIRTVAGDADQRNHKTQKNVECVNERYRIMCTQFDIFRKMDIQRDEWYDFLNTTWDHIYSKGESNYLEIYQKFQKQYGYNSRNKKHWAIIGEQLAVFFIYVYFCGAVYDDDVYAKTALSIFLTRWVQEFTMCMWNVRNKQIETKDISEVTYRFAREIEHSDYNLDILEAFVREHK